MSYFDILPPEITAKFFNDLSLYQFLEAYPYLSENVIRSYIYIHDKTLYKQFTEIVKDFDTDWVEVTGFLFDDAWLMDGNSYRLNIMIDTDIEFFKENILQHPQDYEDDLTENIPRFQFADWLSVIMIYRDYPTLYKTVVDYELHKKYGTSIFYWMNANLRSGDIKNVILSPDLDPNDMKLMIRSIPGKFWID